MEHFFQNIQGWFIYDSYYTQAVNDAKDGAHFVEVGAWKGRSSAFMTVTIANSGKKIQFDVIDTWLGSPGIEVCQTEPHVVAGTLYQHFLSNMAPAWGYFTPIRLSSAEAVKLYADECLDFCLIDASHDYEDVKLDIQSWLPKVKKGGVLAGDDYAWEGVGRAVQELLPDAIVHSSIGCWYYTKPA